MAPTGVIRFSEPRVWLLPAITVALALALVLTGSNRAVFHAVNQLDLPGGDRLWSAITILGDLVVASALALTFARRRPDLLWALVLAALFGAIWVTAFKPFLDWPRPLKALDPSSIHLIGKELRRFSFPSGHATTAFVVAGIVVLGLRRPAWTVIAIVAATLVALSRMAVGAHWPLDVLAGAFGGWMSAAAGLRIAHPLAETIGLRPPVQWIVTAMCAGCAVALTVGTDTGYPAATLVARAIGVIVLAVFALTFLTAKKKT